MHHATMPEMAPEMDVVVPASTKFPIELEPPPGFVVDDPGTWPRIDGRLEYVSGRLLWMPPCGTYQQRVALCVAGILWDWLRTHVDFVGGSNEAGIIFGGDVRGAEGAVWRRADVLVAASDRYVAVPPILAVEVAGRDEREPQLREKARWYIDRGVAAVWLVLPHEREVVVLDRDGRDARHRLGDLVPARPELPGLSPEVAAFFTQLA